MTKKNKILALTGQVFFKLRFLKVKFKDKKDVQIFLHIISALPKIERSFLKPSL